jgi:hypothetical protein
VSAPRTTPEEGVGMKYIIMMFGDQQTMFETRSPESGSGR